MEVAVEKDSSGTRTEKDHVYATVFMRPDCVKILDTGIDIGGNRFDPVAHESVDSATVT